MSALGGTGRDAEESDASRAMVGWGVRTATPGHAAPHGGSAGWTCFAEIGREIGARMRRASTGGKR